MAKKIGRLRLMAGAAAAAGALTFAAAAPASAIHAVDPFSCYVDQTVGKREYFAFHTQNPRTGQMMFNCFANAGTQQLGWGGTRAFNSGNNAGIFVAQDYGGTYWAVKFSKWQYEDWGYKDLINLVIY